MSKPILLPTGTFIDETGTGVSFSSECGILAMVASPEEDSPGVAAKLTAEAALELARQLRDWGYTQGLRDGIHENLAVINGGLT